MKNTKLLSIVLSALLATSVLAGCGKTAAPAKASKTDTSKAVNLTMYLLGAAPTGMPDVMTALNKKLKTDINASLVINYIGWSDLAAKYPLILASGEDLDMIYTADWAYYQQEAVKGAFREITQADMSTYMPKNYAAVNKVAYSQLSVSGKNYMIPTSTPDRKIPEILIRGDLRTKYNIPVIKNMSEMEPFLAAIKKNEPSMVPMNLDSQYDIGTPFNNLEFAYGFNGVPLVGANEVYSDFTTKDGKLGDRFTLSAGDTFTKAANTMKAWYDKGYINKNPFANKVRSADSIIQGKSAVAFGNTVDIQADLSKAKDQGMTLEIIPVVNTAGKNIANSYLNNGIAIAKGSKNPERAMMAMDLMMQNPAYDMLVYFGIEGTNYAITSDGKIGLPAGLTADKNTYPPDASGFWFTNKDVFKPLATWTDDYIAQRTFVKSALVDWVLAPFAFDPSTLKTEQANLTQVDQQYGNPIFVGAVSNVAAAIKEFQAKQKAAGSDKMFTETKAQVDKFLAAIKK